MSDTAIFCNCGDDIRSYCQPISSRTSAFTALSIRASLSCECVGLSCTLPKRSSKRRTLLVKPDVAGHTEQVEKGLYLCCFGVPFDGLAYMLGSDGMYWYRAYCSFGRGSIVGVTVKAPERLLEHLLAGESQTWWRIRKVKQTVSSGIRMIGEDTSEFCPLR